MNTLALRLAVFLILLAGANRSIYAQESKADLAALEEQAFKQAAALVNPSIVRIETVGGLDRVDDVLTGTGPTTGVIVSEDGYIISSAFNFASKPSSILVTLSDERRFPAKLIATDHLKMLTLLKIDAENLSSARAVPESDLRVGQWAIALGRTFDNTVPSVSVGIISALNRIWGKAIQTDAKISPVNYGGPLVDVQGRVMGILVPLSAQESGETAGVEWYDSGIGFAIPLESIHAALDRLKAGEDLHRGLMGISFKDVQDFTAEAVIDRVRYNSPAQQAGLEPGDRLIEVEGKPVQRHPEVRQILGDRYAGNTVAVTLKRGDEVLKKEITLVAELTPYESAFLGILPVRSDTGEGGRTGVAVRHVLPDSPAEKAGLQARDIITGLQDTEIENAGALADLISRLRPEETVTIIFQREGEEKTAEVALASIPDSVVSELRSPVLAPPEKPADEHPDEQAPKVGRLTHELPGHEHDYWAYVPEDYNPAHRYGLMVWIHPGGDTMEAALLNQWRTICDQRGIILIGPKAAKISGWNVDEAEFVKAATEEFLKTYSIDPNRVFLHTHSSGGQFAFHLAFKYRELFRGVAASSTPLLARPPENHPDHRLQFHFACGANHQQYRLVEAVVEALRKRKFPTSLTVIPDHTDAYPEKRQVEEIGRWADSLDRI